jgi:hypothetical protein
MLQNPSLLKACAQLAIKNNKKAKRQSLIVLTVAGLTMQKECVILVTKRI